MNKKEILEIRKQFTPANCAITRICGCYVDHEKEKKMESKEAFLSLPEEEAFKYFDIFKKTLSGTVGKNILNMEFPIVKMTMRLHGISAENSSLTVMMPNRLC